MRKTARVKSSSWLRALGSVPCPSLLGHHQGTAPNLQQIMFLAETNHKPASSAVFLFHHCQWLSVLGLYQLEMTALYITLLGQSYPTKGT